MCPQYGFMNCTVHFNSGYGSPSSGQVQLSVPAPPAGDISLLTQIRMKTNCCIYKEATYQYWLRFGWRLHTPKTTWLNDHKCRLLQFQGSLNTWIIQLKKSKTQLLSFINPSQSIKLQRASRDTCLLANVYLSICWLLSGSKPVNSQQIEAGWNCEGVDAWYYPCVQSTSMNPKTAVTLKLQ